MVTLQANSSSVQRLKVVANQSPHSDIRGVLALENRGFCRVRKHVRRMCNDLVVFPVQSPLLSPFISTSEMASSRIP